MWSHIIYIYTCFVFFVKALILFLNMIWVETKGWSILHWIQHMWDLDFEMCVNLLCIYKSNIIGLCSNQLGQWLATADHFHCRYIITKLHPQVSLQYSMDGYCCRVHVSCVVVNSSSINWFASKSFIVFLFPLPSRDKVLAL